MIKEIQIEQLKGVFSPVITPFNPDLSVDYKKLIHQCEWLISQEVGLAVFGTNSEANSLSVDEKIFLLDKLVEYGIDPNKLMPGTGCCALSDTIKLTKHAVKLGCSGVLMLPPFYYKAVNDDGLFEYFSNVIDSVNDEKWDNFSIFAGSESFLLKTMQNGGAGCISATANINPKKIFDVYKYWKKSDSIDMQEELNVLRNIVQSYPLIPALKCIVSHFCKDKTWNILRPPLTGLNLSDSKKLIKELDAINFNLIKSN